MQQLSLLNQSIILVMHRSTQAKLNKSIGGYLNQLSQRQKQHSDEAQITPFFESFMRDIEILQTTIANIKKRAGINHLYYKPKRQYGFQFQRGSSYRQLEKQIGLVKEESNQRIQNLQKLIEQNQERQEQYKKQQNSRLQKIEQKLEKVQHRQEKMSNKLSKLSEDFTKANKTAERNFNKLGRATQQILMKIRPRRLQSNNSEDEIERDQRLQQRSRHSSSSNKNAAYVNNKEIYLSSFKKNYYESQRKNRSSSRKSQVSLLRSPGFKSESQDQKKEESLLSDQ